MKMKHIVLALGVGVVLGDTLTVTSTHYEKDRDGDGSPDLISDSYRRGNKKVLLERTTKNGASRSIVRLFYVKGVDSVMEEDSNGDGVWDRLTFYDRDGKVIELFVRGSGTSARPADADALKTIQQDADSWKQFWEKSMP